MKRSLLTLVTLGLLTLICLPLSAQVGPGTPQLHAVQVDLVGQGTVEVDQQPLYGGTTFSTPTTTVYFEDPNSQGVNLQWTATAADGWVFDHWEYGPQGNLVTSSDNPLHMVLEPGASSPTFWTVRAVFTQGYVLTINKQGEGTTNPAVGTHPYTQGEVVQICATPAAGHQFDHWEGDVANPGNACTTVTMNSSKTVTAVFAQIGAVTLTINKQGEGTTDPAVGVYAYTQGAVVPVCATAADGWVFDHWDGDVANPNAPATSITMNENKTITANFAQDTPPANGLDDDVEAGPGDWTAESLWHITERDSHSPTHSWWFGDERTGTYGSGTYSPQGLQCRERGDIRPMAATGRVQGVLTSAPISVSNWGQTATLSFWHWRHVEDYTDAPYDRTYVQVTFDGAVWQTVWSQDSRDPSQKDWETVSVAVPIQDGATQMRVRFVFDSVDGVENDYPGWFIDDIRLGPSGDTDVITVIAPLVNGTVGEIYGPVQLRAYGGVAPYTWAWRPAVPGLLLDQRTGTISGTPTTAGKFNVTITVMDSSGRSGTLVARITIEPDGGCACSLFSEDFTDAAEWTMSGLWGVESGLGCINYASMMDDYAYFGRSGACSYATGARVMGELRSPAIDIPDCVETVVIEFDQFRHVESYIDAYDKTWLEVSFDGTTWEPLWYRDSASVSPEGSHVQIGRAVPSGATQMWIRFRFDSVDRFYNDFPGWAIDSVEVLNADCVAGAPSPASLVVLPKAAPRDQISVTNAPNPITDVHTTVFTVRGVGVEAMKIQIFDLSGALMYEEEVAGNELVWHTDSSNYGEHLANGVYLYRALVKVGGSWITTSTQKLVILR